MGLRPLLPPQTRQGLHPSLVILKTCFGPAGFDHRRADFIVSVAGLCPFC